MIVNLQIMALKNKEPTESIINLNIKETEGSCSNKSENSSEIKLEISRTPRIDSPLTSLQQHHHHYQPIPNLFHNLSSRQTDHDHHNHLHAQKTDQSVTIKEESLCNMFVGIEDQSGFWPWLEQQPQYN